MSDNKVTYYGLIRAILIPLIAAAMMLLPAGARAQRTMRGQWHAGTAATATLSPKAGSHPGFGIEAGRYTMTARWSASIRGIIPTGGGFGSLTATGAWMYRAAATSNRALNLYCGGGAFLGFDFDEVNGAVREVISDGGTDSSATWSQGDEGSARHSSFTYGLEPAAELELFITRKAALVAAASLPIRLLTRQETLSLRASAGIRINF